MSCGDLRILFRVAAGPRRGFGHLFRCRSLARALDVRPLIALRGGERVADSALALGCDVVRGTARQLIGRLAPDVVVVDDPIAAAARHWIRAAKRAGCLAVSLQDFGIGRREADLVIDSSSTPHAQAIHGTTLAGLSFAVLDPSVQLHAVERDPYSVLVALGGGPRAELALDIAEAIATSASRARVRGAGGFGQAQSPTHERTCSPPPARGRITWIGPVRHQHDERARTSAVGFGGGVTGRSTS